MVKKTNIGNSILELRKGDITKEKTDAIVNAANKRLMPGGGVAGAIHKAAGPGLKEKCKKIEGCRTGEAKITNGYNLSAKYVIHTVGPVYSGSKEDPKKLASCYKESIKLAADNEIESISFPAISTGAFGYPIEKAAEIALKSTIDSMEEYPEVELVRFVLYNSKDLEVHKEKLDQIYEQ